MLKSVEALPITLPVDSRFFAIHILDVVDALDTTRSVLDYFPNGAVMEIFPNGAVMEITKHVFKTARIRNRHIFKLPEAHSSDVYLSELFKSTVEKNDLKGILFEKVR